MPPFVRNVATNNPLFYSPTTWIKPWFVTIGALEPNFLYMNLPIEASALQNQFDFSIKLGEMAREPPPIRCEHLDICIGKERIRCFVAGV
jgi:hypothetical protein